MRNFIHVATHIFLLRIGIFDDDDECGSQTSKSEKREEQRENTKEPRNRWKMEETI